MSRTLELPEAVYAALERAAADRGMTLVAWITARAFSTQPPMPDDAPAGTLAERMAPYLGVIDSGIGDLSVNCGEKFTDYLEEKRRAGHL